LNKVEKDQFFEEAFFPYMQQLYNFAFSMVNDEDEAKDLVQDTFVKAYRFIDSFEKGTNVKAWLFRILKNTFINEYRRKTNLPYHVSLSDLQHVDEDGRTEDFVHGEDYSEYYKNMMGDEVSIALNSLPDEFKTIIMLSDLEDFTYEEMAKILEIPVGTVRSRLFRARNSLKEKLKAYGLSRGYQEKR
jgi:RNA polymerase sigma factor (sigma-70 family)